MPIGATTVVSSSLTPTQRAFLDRFFGSGPPSEHFYLSGGTALGGFHLHHRLSDDIDLFTRDADRIPLAQSLVEACLRECGLQVTDKRSAEAMLQYLLEGDTHPSHPLRKLDIVLDTPPAFAAPELHGVVRVDALVCIAVNKLTAVFSRGDEIKDYVDLYFILKKKPLDLDTLLPMAAQKDLGFDDLRLAGTLLEVSRLQGLLPFLQRYMIETLDADELIQFCETIAGRIFDRHPPRLSSSG